MRNPAEGSEYACCHQHSTGRMCSACEDGYAMANGQCQECQRIHWLSVSFYIAVRGPGCCCQREGGGVCVRGGGLLAKECGMSANALIKRL